MDEPHRLFGYWKIINLNTDSVKREFCSTKTVSFFEQNQYNTSGIYSAYVGVDKNETRIDTDFFILQDLRSSCDRHVRITSPRHFLGCETSLGKLSATVAKVPVTFRVRTAQLLFLLIRIYLCSETRLSSSYGSKSCVAGGQTLWATRPWMRWSN